MKKLIWLILCLIPLNSYAISASSAIVMDTDNNRILYGYNLNDERLIASITKIMTAIVAIEYGDINKKVVVTDVIEESFGSGIYIKVGEELTLKDLLYGLMLRSGNDAALMIAEFVAGSVDEFVYLMNDTASKIGMKNTTFYNPHGLEDSKGVGNTSTSYDMALLTSYAIKNDTFKEIFKTKKYTAKSSTKAYVWHNKNKLLKHDFITGGKTGFTEKARRTLVSTGTKDDINLVVVTLNDPNDWKDHTDLYNSIFDNYENIEIINKEKFKINDKYYPKNSLYIKNSYNMTLNKKEIKGIKLEINLIKLETYDNDDLVGHVLVSLDGKVYHKEPIYIRVVKDKENNSLWDKVKGWFSW